MTPDDGRPVWLEDALQRHTTKRGEVADDDRVVERGEIRLIGSMDSDLLARLGLVLDVDGDRSVTFALLSNMVENATDLDVILTTDVTRLPYDLIAETDIVGTGWQWQLSGPLAYVPAETADAIERLPRFTDLHALSILRGMPLSGRNDVRWDWKESEVLELQSLTADCVRTLINAPVIDMGFLASNGLDRTLVQDMLLITSDLAISGAATIPPSSAESLGFGEAPTVDRMVEILGADAWLVLSELLISSVSNDYHINVSHAGVVPHRRVDTNHDPLHAVIASSQATLRVITWNELWDDDGSVIEMEVGGQARRVIRDLVAA